MHFTTISPQKHHDLHPLFPKHPSKTQQNNETPARTGASIFFENNSGYDAFLAFVAGAFFALDAGALTVPAEASGAASAC